MQVFDDVGMVIVAGGSSQRFGGGNKLLLPVKGLPIFLYSVKEFATLFPRRIVLVVPATEIGTFQSLVARHCPDLQVLWALGGATRSDSVQSGLAVLPSEVKYVAIHDAARPLAKQQLLSSVLAKVREVDGAIPGKPVTDTLKRTTSNGIITETVDRAELWRVETPQVFELEKLRYAYEQTPSKSFTDDAGVMEAVGYKIAIVLNREENLKITYGEDVDTLLFLLNHD